MDAETVCAPTLLAQRIASTSSDPLAADFDVRFSQGQPLEVDVVMLPDIQVGLRTDADGKLVQ